MTIKSNGTQVTCKNMVGKEENSLLFYFKRLLPPRQLNSRIFWFRKGSRVIIHSLDERKGFVPFPHNDTF